jgi:hypothetical protein
MEVSPMTSNRGLWVRWLRVDADQRVDPVCSSSFLDGCSGGRGRPIEAFPTDVGREGNFEQTVLGHSAENIERKTIVHFVAGSDPTCHRPNMLHGKVFHPLADTHRLSTRE